MGEITTDVDIVTLNSNGLDKGDTAGIAVYYIPAQGGVGGTGDRVKDDEAPRGLTIDLGELPAYGQLAVRQGLNGLDLAVELRGKGADQLAGIDLVACNKFLLYLLPRDGVFNEGKVAAGVDGIAQLVDGLNSGVELAGIAGATVSAGAPGDAGREARR